MDVLRRVLLQVRADDPDLGVALARNDEPAVPTRWSRHIRRALRRPADRRGQPPDDVPVQTRPLAFGRASEVTTTYGTTDEDRLGARVAQDYVDFIRDRPWYEFDFLTRDRWFAGFLLEAKYTDVKVQLDNPIESQFAHARGPIPAIGGIGRFYVVPNISITGELTGIKVPDSISKDFRTHYADLDIYGTVNFSDHTVAAFVTAGTGC